MRTLFLTSSGLNEKTMVLFWKCIGKKNRLTQKRFWFHPPQLEMMVREKESLYVWSAL